jgi:hypothetical protein
MTMRILRAACGPSVAVAVLLLALAAHACDTPVYQYTLLYWEQDGYLVYYFYRGSEPPQDAAVNAELEKMAKSHANIWFGRVDVATLGAEGRTGLAQQVWAQYSKKEPPLYVVLTPRRTELFSGRLDLASLETFVKSPKRTQIVKLLCEGKHGVLVLLKGPLAGENAAAERVVRATLARAKEAEIEVGLVVVQRDDPKEQWFVRQLLALEPDLPQLKNPMLFPVFGRGHVLEPFLGKGITEANMVAVIQFLNGPCSCEIKMANFGMDFITDWNWEYHIARMELPEEPPTEWALFDVQEPTPAAQETEKAEEPTRRANEPVADAPKQEPAKTAQEPPRQRPAAAKPPKEPVPARGEVAKGAKPSEPDPASDEPDAPAALEEVEVPPLVAEEARGPSLPRPVEPVAVAAEQKPAFAAVLGHRLGLVLGGVGLLVLVVGVVLVKTRRES